MYCVCVCACLCVCVCVCTHVCVDVNTCMQNSPLIYSIKSAILETNSLEVSSRAEDHGVVCTISMHKHSIRHTGNVADDALN